MKRYVAGLTAVIAAAAFSVHASAGLIGPFELDAEGTFTQTFAPDFSTTNILITAAVTADPDGLGFTALTADVTADITAGNPFPSTGFFVLTGPGGTLTADVTGVFFDVLVPFTSAAGTFVVTGGTGIYSGLVGLGVFSAFSNLGTANAIEIDLGGILDIPAPGALGLLGIAGLGLAGRRRRAA